MNNDVQPPQQTARQVYLPKDLKQSVTDLASGKCAEFLEQLYRTVAEITRKEPQSKNFNILEVFNAVTNREGAIIFTPDLRSPSGKPIGGTVSGTLGERLSPATIELNAYTYFNILPESGRKYAEYLYAKNTIHESFHLAAKGSRGLTKLLRLVAKV